MLQVISTAVVDESKLFALFHFSSVRCYDPDPNDYQDFVVRLQAVQVPAIFVELLDHAADTMLRMYFHSVAR
jgi:hypothetical protein